MLRLEPFQSLFSSSETGVHRTPCNSLCGYLRLLVILSYVHCCLRVSFPRLGRGHLRPICRFPLTKCPTQLHPQGLEGRVTYIRRISYTNETEYCGSYLIFTCKVTQKYLTYTNTLTWGVVLYLVTVVGSSWGWWDFN